MNVAEILPILANRLARAEQEDEDMLITDKRTRGEDDN